MLLCFHSNVLEQYYVVVFTLECIKYLYTSVQVCWWVFIEMYLKFGVVVS